MERGKSALQCVWETTASVFQGGLEFFSSTQKNVLLKSWIMIQIEQVHRQLHTPWVCSSFVLTAFWMYFAICWSVLAQHWNQHRAHAFTLWWQNWCHADPRGHRQTSLLLSDVCSTSLLQCIYPVNVCFGFWSTSCQVVKSMNMNVDLGHKSTVAESVDFEDRGRI